MMPVGIQRFNAKKLPPNPRIVFIKPLKGPDEILAQQFLERIAAQCVPVMREHHLNVMTVEEFPPNREFVGRNFNAGEVIQLVLKSFSGRWLPFNYVQMVMMHELAHCKQMNHSKAFWSVRNQYAAQMQGLWAKGYTGEGLWGRGTTLGTGEWDRNTVHADEPLPEHLCGGTYRSQRTKRKAKRAPVPTYKERKERRILKKFGTNGVTLGADEDAKAKLEKGKTVRSKPRVAGSTRGRELRAMAALARLEQNKPSRSDNDGKKEEEQEDSDNEFREGAEMGSDSSDYEGIDSEQPAIDVDGNRLVDKDGRGLVKVCSDDDDSTEGQGALGGELDELRGLFFGTVPRQQRRQQEQVRGKSETSMAVSKATNGSKDNPTLRSPIDDDNTNNKKESDSNRQRTTHIGLTDAESEKTTKNCCSMCSFANPAFTVTCSICSNVLDLAQMPNAWRCSRASCKDSTYMNAGDCGVCGLCGERRTSPANRQQP